MRILRITAKDIASLSGSHTIDFTKEPLRSAGLFSISGPTGSGKSTILDCLCIALYDRTPRLDGLRRKVGKLKGESQADPSALLRRGAGSGMAEVAFVGLDGLEWTARWEIRRSRRDSNGKLQPPEMTLFRGLIQPTEKGNVECGGKKKIVLEAIQEKIGLTFEQFTRAVLLAQNDFAAFLKASDSERSGILQALTGTQQYEDISKAIYERAQLECRTVDNARQRFASNPTLSDDERKETEDSHRKLLDELEGVEQKIKHRQDHETWFKGLAKLEQETQKAEDRLRLATDGLNNAAFRKAELEITEHLKREVQTLRSDQKRTETNLADSKSSVSELERIFDDCEHTKGDLRRALEGREDELLRLKELADKIRIDIKSARDLDSKLLPLQQQLLNAETERDTTAKASNVLEEQLRVKQLEMDGLSTSITELLEEQNKDQHYAHLAKESSLWIDRLERLTRLRSELHDKQNKLHEAELQQKEALDLVSSLLKDFESRRSIISEIEEQLKSNSLALSATDIEVLEDRRSGFDEDIRILNRYISQIEDYQRLQQSENRLKTDYDELVSEQSTDGDHLQSRLSDLSRLEIAWETSKTQADRIRDSIDDHALKFRHTLADGQPCPVCGSLEHPYSNDPPVYELVALSAADEFHKKLDGQLSKLKLEVNKIDASLEIRGKSIQQKSDDLIRIKESLIAFEFESHEHPLVIALQSLSEKDRLLSAQSVKEERANQIQVINQELKNHRDALSALESLRKRLEKERSDLAELEQGRMNALLQEQQCLQDSNAYRSDVRDLSGQVNEENDRLVTVWSAWPEASTEYLSDSSRFIENLQDGTSRIHVIDEKLIETRQQLTDGNAVLSGLREKQTQFLKDVENARVKWNSAYEAVESVLSERKHILKGRDANEVEREMDTTLSNAKADAERAETEFNRADKQASIAKQQLSDARDLLSTAVEAWLKADQAMNSWIQEFNQTRNLKLTLEDIDCKLKLSQAWVDEERSALITLSENVKTAEGAFMASKERLVNHQGKRPCEDTLEEIVSHLEALTTTRIEIQGKLDDVRILLVTDDKRKFEKSQLLEDIKHLEEQSAPWQQLNELIGSADGAKFRLVAQRHTLDMLLSYANQQLSHLSPRYRLERPEESLNLMVIDCDMGDEMRSVHSLSGGESFLVSLALALGLASLTSERVRVESLFIDEGFGCLDPETLNVAMGALMQLESQGRKVGVISHVQEMTDAIPVQIKVQKGRGGASRITIPGHSSITNEFQTVPGT